MIETLQTLRQFQRQTGRVLVAGQHTSDGMPPLRGPSKPQSPATTPVTTHQVTCPKCLAREAKDLARVRKHRALKPKPQA